MALLGLTLVQDELERGVLAVPFGPSLPGLRYHLLRSPATRGDATLDRVAAWLQTAFAASASACRQAVVEG